MPKSFLIIQRGGEIGQRINLSDGRVSVGRNADNSIVLNDGLVSRYHAVFTGDSSGQVAVTDLGSTNGVMINDRLIPSGVPTPLKHRDLVFVGKSIFNLQVRADSYTAPRPPSREDSKNTLQFSFKRLFS